MREKCRQDSCTSEADYRYTWPGKDESFICQAHSEKLKGIAGAMGASVAALTTAVGGDKSDLDAIK